MLRRSVYVLALRYSRSAPHPFVIANAMHRASYVSLQSALAYYGMIPEYTPVTTSLTTRRPEDVQTPLGHFVYRHIKTPLLFGFREEEVIPGQRALLATPEKALIDLLYLTPGSDAPGYLAELRLERTDAFEQETFLRMAAQTGAKKVVRAAHALQQLWAQEEGYTPL